MKRFFAILLCLVMVCALVACNNSTPNNGNNDNNGTNGTNGTNDNNGNETNNGGTVNGTAYRVGLGMTVESTVSPAEDDDDDDGRAEAAVTTCALLLDQEGKILSVTFDCVEAAASYNTSGNVTWPDTYKSKKELGYDYGLKKYSSIGKEWFEQVNALEDYCTGKTVSDVSSMQLKEENGKQEIPAAAELTSSCTISCDQFIDALKKAEMNVK